MAITSKAPGEVKVGDTIVLEGRGFEVESIQPVPFDYIRFYVKVYPRQPVSDIMYRVTDTVLVSHA